MRAPPEAATMMTAAAIRGSVFDRARDLFADDRTHRGGEKAEIHHRDRDLVAFDHSVAAQDRVDQSGAVLIFSQAILVGRHALELEGCRSSSNPRPFPRNVSGSSRFSIRSLADSAK